MSTGFVIAVYGAILSTILGCITINNFIRDRRILRVEKRFTYDLKDADYNFIISNISPRPFTIIDCMASALSKTDAGKLEFDWGIAPKLIKSMLDADEDDLELPILLHPGAVLMVRVSSADIIDEFKLHANRNYGPKWTPTKNMILEITHSMSKIIHEEHFQLERDELERAQVVN
jgi:hypothetical protein